MSTQQQSDPQKNLNQFNKFLANNTDFLNQKYNEHFINPFPYNQLQTKAKIDTTIKFIYDVFSFQKYEKDQKMNATLKKSLRQNILSFLKGQSSKQTRQFNPNDGIKLLKYCIENNEMFAVHYDKKEKKQIKQESPKQQKKPQQIQTVDQKEQQQEPIKNQQPKTQQKNDQEVTQNQVIINISQISQKTQKQKNQQSPKQQTLKNNEFSQSNKTEQEKRRKQILKKQAKIVFEFYCKQQLNTGGPNATFDKISHESNTMTLGKFMAFANTTRILFTAKVQALKQKNYKVLDKKTINELFRKVSKAQKQIDFDKFFQLLCALNQVDNTVYEKLNMDRSETHNKILRRLKYLNTPFSMKGYLQDDARPVIDQKPYIPINTAHSGKFQSSLRQEIEERKLKLRLLPHQPYPNPHQIKINDTFIVESRVNQNILENDLFENKIKVGNKFFSDRKGQSKTTTDEKRQISKIRLENSRIFFDKGQKLFSEQIQALQNLIVPDDVNDDEFLKDYKIPKLGSNSGLNKKPNNISFSLRQNQQGRQSARKFSGLKTQRKNVVGQLKQRIKQIELNERKQMTGLQNKRRAISHFNKY